MLDIALDYARNAGSIVTGATNMAEDLMRDDPATFKRGYSYGSAILAVAEAFELSERQRAEVVTALSGRMDCAAADSLS